MNRITENKIILIKRKTRLEELIARFNTIEQARFYIEHLGSDFSDYLREDQKYKSEVNRAEQTLAGLGRLQIISREFLSNFVFGPHDTVVAIGQDGLVVNTLKYLSGQLLIGVNPDSDRWDGALLPFCVDDLSNIISDVFKSKRQIKTVSMAQAVLNDGQKINAVNDLFIGQKTHVSSRYQIRYGNSIENQSSSGIIVSTGLGATGWLKSIIAGAGGIISALKSDISKIKSLKQPPWNADYLYFSGHC